MTRHVWAFLVVDLCLMVLGAREDLSFPWIRPGRLPAQLAKPGATLVVRLGRVAVTGAAHVLVSLVSLLTNQPTGPPFVVITSPPNVI
jgi:hypothetical protein